jgi:hypothetical protein
MEYTRIYKQIIERAQNRKLEGYIEKHHITPKCIGGLDIQENIVELTAREHFLCHRLLCEMYPTHIKLWYALFLMSINKNKKLHQKYKVSSREYERIKIEWNKHSKGRKKPVGFGDKITSDERNKKIGLSNSKPKPNGFGKTHSEKMKGKPKPDGFGEIVTKNKSKCILQFNLNGEFIKEWPSGKEASRILNINPSTIAGNARENGINKSAGGFIWKYKNQFV